MSLFSTWSFFLCWLWQKRCNTLCPCFLLEAFSCADCGKRDVIPCVPVFYLKLFLVLIVINNFVTRSYYSSSFILLEAFSRSCCVTWSIAWRQSIIVTWLSWWISMKSKSPKCFDNHTGKKALHEHRMSTKQTTICENKRWYYHSTIPH